MSNLASEWAEEQPTGSAGTRQLLVTMALAVRDKPCTSKASGKTWPPYHCYLSIGSMVEKTLQDRKTVIQNLRRLQEAGFIVRAEGCDGNTNQTPVYELQLKSRPVPKQELAPVPKLGPAPIPKTELAQRATGTNSSGDQYQVFRQPVPKTGHETVFNRMETVLGADAPLPPASLPPCPIRQLVALFVSKVPELPRPRIELWQDSAGAEAMRQRWKWVLSPDTVREDGSRYARTAAEAIAWFTWFFESVAASDFLTGRAGGWGKCDLAWLMKRENFMKVVQGNYDNKPATPSRAAA